MQDLNTRGARARRTAAAMLVSTAAIVGLLAAPAVAGSRSLPRPPWSSLRMGRATPSAAPPASSQLNGASCPSRSDCWAVGSKTAANSIELNEALRWNGKKWTKASTPDPGGKSSDDQNELLGVTCTSASDCWAVGYYTHNFGPQATEALHWNGKKWSLVSTPGADGSGASRGGIGITISKNQLVGVACASASDCWAVGTRPSGSGALLNKVLRFNGKKWSSVLTPEPGGTSSGDRNELNGVSCTSATECSAVGEVYNGTATQNEVLRFNGRKWSFVSTPQPGGTSSGDDNQLNGVSCTSVSRCLAVGTTQSGSGPQWNEALRFNGKKWSELSPLQPGSFDLLISISCTSGSNCWAVGTGEALNASGVSTIVNQAQWWNGQTWAAFSTPQPGGTGGADLNQLNSVACVSSSDCRAVGQVMSGTASPNEKLHWNGRKWSSR